MPADVCAWVAAKIRAWTFPLLPGCTNAKCHRSPGPLLWFLYMESATRTGSKSETEPFDRTGARCLLKANMPVSSQECSCWVHVWAVKRPSLFVFHLLECKLYHWIAFTACSLLAWGYTLMHFFTVGKLHWHFSGWISPYWTRNFWGGKLLFCVEQHPHPLSNAHIQRNACKVSPGSYFIAIPHPLDAQMHPYVSNWCYFITSCCCTSPVSFEKGWLWISLHAILSTVHVLPCAWGKVGAAGCFPPQMPKGKRWM